VGLGGVVGRCRRCVAGREWSSRRLHDMLRALAWANRRKRCTFYDATWDAGVLICVWKHVYGEKRAKITRDAGVLICVWKRAYGERRARITRDTVNSLWSRLRKIDTRHDGGGGRTDLL
jgi:hypothetical protein